MKGAQGLLISITGGRDMTLFEVDEAATRIREEVDADANIILGATFDEALEGLIRVSVVATGIDRWMRPSRRACARRPAPSNRAPASRAARLAPMPRFMRRARVNLTIMAARRGRHRSLTATISSKSRPFCVARRTEFVWLPYQSLTLWRGVTDAPFVIC
jgi:cell division protein FtsZ